MPDKRVILQMVGKRVMLSKGEPWAGSDPFSQIVVIGKYGRVDSHALEAQFGACAAGTPKAGENPFTDAIVHVLRQ